MSPGLPHLDPIPGCTLAALLLVGCAGPSGDLALAEDWELVPPSEDPIEGRPTDIPACPRRALAIEAGALEADTTVCDWITAEAPARFKLRRGRELELFLFHQALSAPEPAEAVIGVRVEGAEDWLWSQTVPVPSTTGFYDEWIELDQTIDEGDRLLFHVHNHGANTYTLGHLKVP